MQESEMLQNNKPVIAIDGTAGSGKGTLAKKLAKGIIMIATKDNFQFW